MGRGRSGLPLSPLLTTPPRSKDRKQLGLGRDRIASRSSRHAVTVQQFAFHFPLHTHTRPAWWLDRLCLSLSFHHLSQQQSSVSGISPAAPKACCYPCLVTRSRGQESLDFVWACLTAGVIVILCMYTVFPACLVSSDTLLAGSVSGIQTDRQSRSGQTSPVPS